MKCSWIALSPLPYILLAISFLGSIASAETELWGKTGEKWTPDSVLPDFSFAGFENGASPLPDPTPELSVADYGAADGKDSTEAFQKAIDAGAGKCIAIPEGKFILTDRIRITAPGTTLKGHGPGKTELHFTRGLQEIEPREGRTGGGLKTTSWSWMGGLIVIGHSGLDSGGKTKITSETKRGERTFAVSDASAFEVGGWLMVELRDDSEGSFSKYLYRGDPGDISSIKGKTQAQQAARIEKIEGAQITVNRPLRYDLRPAWNPTAMPFKPRSHHVGVSGITISFPPVPYRGHWKEDGLNGIAISGIHNWAKDIEIRDCDSGIYMDGHFNTVDGVRIVASRKPHSSGNTGHHGLTATGQDCLFTRFAIETKFFHDLTLDSAATGNVFSNGKGEDLCFDFHRYAPYENIFTAIDLGNGTRPWNSGGAGGRGRHTAAGATFWNIDSKVRFDLPRQDFGPDGLVFVGLNANSVRRSALRDGWHYERETAGRMEPADLHQAQLERRLRSHPTESADTRQPGSSEFQPWTNLEGVTINARFLSADEDTVKFQLKDGKIVDYPLAKLDGPSRELVRTLKQKN